MDSRFLIDFLINNSQSIVGFIITIILTFVIAAWVRKLLNKFLDSSSSKLNRDQTNLYFLRYIVVAFVYIVGLTIAIYQVPAFRALGTTLLAGAGVFALAVSFASQQALSNIVSGIFIIIFKPFKLKDRITLKSRDLNGVIEDITLRHTVIKDYENRRIIVPNSIISDEVIINSDYSDSRVCKWIDIGIGYNSDIKKAKGIIQEISENHPDSIDVRKKSDIANGVPKVIVRVTGLADSSVDLRAFVWTKDISNSMSMYSDILEQVKERFDRENIEIPFPHQSLFIKKE